MKDTSSSSSSESVQPPLKSYVYMAVGILFLLHPIVSFLSKYVLPNDGKLHYLHEYW
eukprot:CAMPEP_0116142642 /NCGR_PEP_ID=MMETSP0329-20121206/15019_1 /TAXON_ID=697910 /ORGANISM="Pseudo-nitzschia arenysensis, Strain B593" /LENGTH=56 /DNA_ID=CAMNT_0003637895 /DNA_START=87 /DNA_END=254 /DNA_ORIENTATION=+